MGLHRDSTYRLTQLLRNVAAVSTLSPDIDRLTDVLATFERTAGQTKVIDVLAAAVAAGDLDQPVLFTAALAEQAATAAQAAEVVAGVRQRIHRRIRDAAAVDGERIYRAACEQFDAAAGKFLAATTAVDVEAPAETVVELADKARTAWRDAPGLAEELDRLAVAVHSAGVLAGLVPDDLDGEIAAVVDAGDCDPETIKAAWDIRTTEARAARAAANAGPHTGRAVPTVTRCGRWSRLLACGATIRAMQPQLAKT